MYVLSFHLSDEVSNRGDFKVIHKTRSGQITFNDTFQQLSTHEIPFGGCGESGCMCCSYILHQASSMTTFFFAADGAYFGKFSFDTFTHLRGSVNVPLPYVRSHSPRSTLLLIFTLSAEPAFALRYPPYTKEAYNSALTAASRVQIPAT